MKQKLTRHDLKRNELAETVGRTVDYVGRHRRGVTETAAIVIGLSLAVGGFFLFRSYREASAGKELSAGLAILETPLASEPSTQGAVKTYATRADRSREAEARLAKAASYGGTAAGRAARVILAARREKSAAQSQETFTHVAREGKAEVAAVAEIDAARFLASEGKTAEAVDRLKRSIESPDSAAPKDALLFALAEIYERAGSSADARATFQRLVKDYPDSPYRADAQGKQ